MYFTGADIRLLDAIYFAPTGLQPLPLLFFLLTPDPKMGEPLSRTPPTADADRLSDLMPTVNMLCHVADWFLKAS